MSNELESASDKAMAMNLESSAPFVPSLSSKKKVQVAGNPGCEPTRCVHSTWAAGARSRFKPTRTGGPGRVGVRNPHRDRPRSATLARGLKLQACNFSTADGNLDDFVATRTGTLTFKPQPEKMRREFT